MDCKDNVPTLENKTSRDSLLICIAIILALYVILFGFILHNICNYVIKQKRYRTFQVSYFYILAVLIVFARVIFFSMLLVVVTDTETTSDSMSENTDRVDNYATYLELVLGVQQLSTMTELYLMVRNNLNLNRLSEA